MNYNDEKSKSSYILALKDEMNAALIGDDNQNYISSPPSSSFRMCR